MTLLHDFDEFSFGLKCLLHYLLLFSLILEHEFSRLLSEIFSILPLIACFFEKLLLESGLSICDIIEFLNVYSEFLCIVFIVLYFSFWLFSGCRPNDPLKFIISLEQLHLEYPYLRNHIVRNVLIGKNTWVVLENSHVLKRAGSVDFNSIFNLKLIVSLSESAGDLALVLDVFREFLFAWV